MRTNLTVALVAFLLLAYAPHVFAYTATTYAQKQCSGGTTIGTTTYNGYDAGCESYCASLTASCCNLTEVENEHLGTDNYTCVAKSGTSATTNQSNTVTNCTTNGEGEYLCKYTSYWATLLSYVSAPTASLVANPTSINTGQSSLLTWSSTNATSCTGTNFSTGNATSGTVSVSPSSTTTYTLSCSGAGGATTSAQTVTVNIFTVSCTASPNPVTINQSTTWTGTATGGSGGYTYAWEGDESLTGSGTSVTKSYTSLGQKNATLSVTSGGSTIRAACDGVSCQDASCQCLGAGCGVVVQGGTNTDVTGSIPSIASGTLAPGGTVTFGGSVENIGNNDISAVFQNRFQVDLGNDGVYDTNLDTGGTSGNAFTLQNNKMCTGGTAQSYDSAVTGTLAAAKSVITSMCQSESTAGQCCSAIVTVNSGGGGGGGGGGGTCRTCQQVRRDSNLTAAVDGPLATADTYTTSLTVYSGNTSLTSCSGQTCYGGTWSPISGTLFTIPFGTWAGTESPSWSNIPIGTHSVRLCADLPSSGLSESNENNNCGPDYTFSVPGVDFTAGTPGLNSGYLAAGNQLTFFGSVTNNATACSVGGTCQAAVTVGSAPAQGSTQSTTFDCSSWGYQYTECPLGVSIASVQSITVNRIYSYCSHQCPNDSTPNPGVNYGITNGNVFWVDHGFRARFTVVYYPSAPQCSLTLDSAHVAWSTVNAANVSVVPVTSDVPVPGQGGGGIVTTGYEPNQYRNQTVVDDIHTNGGLTADLSEYTNSHYVSGLYADGATANRLCYILEGPSSASTSFTQGGTEPHMYQWAEDTSTGLYRWINVGSGPSEIISTLYCRHAGSTYPTSGSYTFPSSLGAGTHTYRVTASNGSGISNTCDATVIVPTGSAPLCQLTASPQNILSGQSSALSWTTNNASSFSISGIGPVTPISSGSASVSPTQTTTYTGTVAGNAGSCDLTGSINNRFQVDLGNNGTWDVNLDAPNSLTNLSQSQSKQVISPEWTAVLGTHAVRLCANLPSPMAEINPNDDCGASFVFTVSSATQCSDGVDNNSNDLIDIADPSCHTDQNPSNGTSYSWSSNETSNPSSALAITSNKTTVKAKAQVVLTWSATAVQANSCTITSTAGDSWSVSGGGGTQTSAPILRETTYTLTCKDLQNNRNVSASVKVKLAPSFQEI